MPTNLLRTFSDGKAKGPKSPRVLPAKDGSVRIATLQAGRVALDIALHQTQTATLIWRALPLFSIAETWGAALHFETPVRAGRDRSARLNARPGDVFFWAEDERILIAWGPTPISRDDEIRLMRPSNVWGHVIGDARALHTVTPGEKIVLSAKR